MGESGSSRNPQDVLRDQFASASLAFDESLTTASNAIKSSTASARDEANKAVGLVQSWYDEVMHRVKTADEIMISTLKEGVVYGMEHTLVTSAGLLGAGMVLLPGMRRLVWRMTFGRYLTPQAATEAAEARLSLMRKELETQQGDIKKLTERLSMAKEEYARGLSKLKGAAKEMRRLETHVQSSESRANELLFEIRNIRSKQALQLRSDAAVVTETAKKQSNQVSSIVYALEKNGM